MGWWSDFKVNAAYEWSVMQTQIELADWEIDEEARERAERKRRAEEEEAERKRQLQYVTTKSELQQAIDRKEEQIFITGDLANKIHNGKKIRTLGKVTVGLLVAAIAAVPFTGGGSFAFAGSVATVAGVETALVIAVCFVGVALLSAVWSGYEEVEFSTDYLSLKLKR